MASSVRPAPSRAWASALCTTANLGNRRTDSLLLLDRRGPLAPVGQREGDLVADGPIVRLQSSCLAELCVRPTRLPDREEGRPERDVRERVVGVEPDHLSEHVGGLRRLAALEEGRPQTSEGQSATGAYAHGDGEEPDGLLGTAGDQKLAPRSALTQK